MQVTIIKRNKLNTFDLPETINGSHWITDFDNGKKFNLLNVEAENGKWKLISNDDTFVINNEGIMIPYVELREYSLYLIRTNYKNENYYLYCSPAYDNTFKEFIINESKQVTIGHGKNNDICYMLGGISDKSFNIKKEDNTYNLYLIDKQASVYVNKKRVNDSCKIQYGDIIFMFGLKIILMRKNGSDYLLVNNPNNLLNFNANFVNINLVKDEFIEDNSELNDEFLNSDINYFYRTPHFYGVLNTYKLKIDTPPQKKEEDKTPAILTVGPMLTMAMSSVVMLMSTMSSISKGERDASSAMTSIVMSIAMLASTLLWPILTKTYQKFANRKYERKRQKKYKKYLDKKEKEILEELERQRQTLINNNFTVDECQKVILSHDVKLWQRRITDSDFLTIPVGIGNLPMQIEMNSPEEHFSLTEDNLLDMAHELGKKQRVLQDVPITFSFYQNITTGVVGQSFLNKMFIDRIILQLMANYSYDEVKTVIFTSSDNENEWEYMKTLPHSWSNDKSFRFFGSSNDDYREIIYVLDKIFNERKSQKNSNKNYESHYVIITDSIKSIESYDFIKNIMKSEENYGFSIIILVDKLSALPNECKNFIEVNKDYCSIFSSIVNSNEKTQFKIDFSKVDDLYDCSKELSNIPVLVKNTAELSLPDVYHFLEMYQVGKIDQLNSQERWKKSNPMLSLQAPIGIGKSGEVINLDLHEKYHGPHGIIAGTTGSGKSEFIITYILSLAVNYHPYEVQIILIDYKGGSLAGSFSNDNFRLPHLAGTITNLDGNELNRSLASIDSEIKRRQRKFNEAKQVTGESTMDIYKYQKLWREGRLKSMEPIAHLFIISDEFAELKEQQPEFMDKLISTARVGRSLGVHLILATQKPGGVVDSQIWSNTRFRVCLKVQDTGDSQEVIKKPDAAYLKKTGRFYLQVGTDEIYTLGQSAWAGGQYYPNTTFKKDVDVSINLINNIGFVINTKELEVKEKVESLGEELPNIVKYLDSLAKNNNISIKKLWLDKIPDKIYIDKIKSKYNFVKENFYINPIIGEYDDPSTQTQNALTVPFSKLGNVVIYGITGSGKEDFITSLLYSCMSTYTPNEVNYYILDFGSETMKVFENSNYCGGVALLNDSEKVYNLFKLINIELEKRKKLFSQYGGSYKHYVDSGKTDFPNKIIVINNYEAFYENYENLIEELTQLSREAYKYGIFFVITTGNSNSLRLKIRNNFALVYALQQNNDSDYSDIIGNCRGKAPSKNKGRGLFRRDLIYEFQTALITEEGNDIKFLLDYCKNNQYDYKVTKIPVMPDVVDYEYIQDELTNPSQLVVGVNKDTLMIEKYNLVKNSVDIISALDIADLYNYTRVLLKQISYFKDNYQLYFINTTDYSFENCGVDKNMFDSAFNEIIDKFEGHINNSYQKYEEAGFDDNLYKTYRKIVLVVFGVADFVNKLSNEAKQKLSNLVKKGGQLEIFDLVLIEEADTLKQFAYEDWFKSGVDQSNGIWIGSGVVDQSIIKLTKYNRDDREEISSEFGYVVTKGRAQRVKLLSSFEIEKM